jgi:glycosyltransferase involved in cell wall biosynthesis
MKKNNSKYILGLVPILAIIGSLIANMKSKIIFSIQGLPRSKIIFNLNLFFLKFLYDVTYVIPTKSMKEYLNINYKQSENIQYQVVPNAVLDNNLISKSKEVVTHKWYITEQIFVITAVGRLTNQKDFTNLINAFALTAGSLDFIRLVIIGSGEQKELLQSLVEDLGLESKVEFLGFQSNPYKYMNASDLFVMSSKWEGPGHVLIEALATGCPVITTNCPIGPADSLQNGEFGELVEVGNSKALSESILYAFNNQSDMLLKVKKSEIFIKKFYTHNVVNEYKKLLINDNR